MQTVEFKPHIASEEVTGSIRSKLQTSIAPESTARIEKMRVVPGQQVKRGDVLVELDTREVRAKLEQAKALSVQSEKSLQRYAALAASKAVSQADYDSALANNRVAQATLDQAQTSLTYMTVVAPFDGVITKKLADVGDLASPRKAILEMEDPGALRFEGDVPEAVIGFVKIGDVLPVWVGTANVIGTVSEMTPVADAQSRTFLVKLDLPQTPGLRTGQFGHASVPINTTNVLRVPASAVIQRGQMELAFVVKDNCAQLRLVKTGKRFGGEVEVLSGIEVGEQVAVDNVATLVDGQPVEVPSK
ncbi:MAG: efflux RND transporter periplasmic adaptor subunit [Chthoniobacteraceae bacterium]